MLKYETEFFNSPRALRNKKRKKSFSFATLPRRLEFYGEEDIYGCRKYNEIGLWFRPVPWRARTHPRWMVKSHKQKKIYTRCSERYYWGPTPEDF